MKAQLIKGVAKGKTYGPSCVTMSQMAHAYPVTDCTGAERAKRHAVEHDLAYNSLLRINDDERHGTPRFSRVQRPTYRH